MAVEPLTSKSVSATHHIRYFILRSKAGLTFGINERKLADPLTVKVLSQLIGEAGIDSTKFAVFFGYNFNEEQTDRTIVIENQQDIYFVHRGLINLPPHLLLK